MENLRTFGKRFLLATLGTCLSLACAKGPPTEAAVSLGAEDGSAATTSRQAVAPVPSGRAPSTVSRQGSSAVPPGNWGGPSVNLTVTASGGTIEFDCGRGSVDQPMVLDSNGRFDVAGTFIREGGPAKENPDRIPARYIGRTDGKTMALTVTIGDTTVGPLTLTFGTQTRLFKCV